MATLIRVGLIDNRDKVGAASTVGQQDLLVRRDPAGITPGRA